MSLPRHSPADLDPADPSRERTPDTAAGTASPQPIGSGTGLRFVLLLVLVAASTVAMTSDHIVLQRVLGDPHNDFLGCQLAAGFDPGAGFWDNSTALEGRNAAALTACVAPYKAAWWASPAVVGIVFVLAAVLCWVMPWWTVRRRGLRPIDTSSPDGAVLRELADRAGVPSARFLADWASASANAVAFGRPGRAQIALGAGLLQSTDAQPDRFAAALLHELAHVRARDVGLTYATIAVWRVFALTMLLPYLARFVELFVQGEFFRTDAYYDVAETGAGPEYLRKMGLCLFTALLVYLSRSDILRTRELHADRRAVECGASLAVWDAAAHVGIPGRGVRRAVRAARHALFAVHPTWTHRAQALRDPRLLVRLPAMPTFLTGAAATLISEHLHYVPGLPSGRSVDHVGNALAGALIAGTTCLTLWRRTAHALDAGRAGPSGARAGFWLGVGLAVGSLLGQTSTEPGRWLQPGAWATLLLALLALMTTCWVAQCARLLVTVLPGAAGRVAETVTLICAAGVFAFWLSWWASARDLFLPGYFTVLSQVVAQALGMADPSSPFVATALVALVTVDTLRPLLLWSTAALWLVPLAAWVGPSSTAWMARQGWPSMRRTVGGGAAAAALALLLALLTAFTYILEGDVRDAAAAARFLAAVLAALLAVPIGVAAGAAARGRRGMPVGATVAGVALALCSALLVLGTAGLDCVLPALISGARCTVFHPTYWPFVTGGLLLLLGPGALAAVIVALCVSTALAPFRARRQRAAPEPAPEPWTRERTAVLVRRRVAVGVMIALVAGLNLLPGTGAAGSGQRSTWSPFANATAPVPATQQARRAQVVAWVRYGGDNLVGELPPVAQEIADGADRLAAGDPGGARSVGSGCAGMVRWAGDARAYFTVPDPDQEAAWERAQSIAVSSGTDCRAALDAGDPAAVAAALERLLAGGRLGYSVILWIQAQLPPAPS